MRASASAFFRDIRMPREALHERYLLDTLAERRVEERPASRWMFWR